MVRQRYLVAGNHAGFTKGVPGEADDIITRMTAARLVYNSLEIELFDSFYSGIYSGSCFPNYYDEDTILSKYLGCELIIGNAKCLDENKIELTLDGDSKEHTDGEVLVLENKYRRIDELDGKKVIAWIKIDDEKSTFLIGEER